MVPVAPTTIIFILALLIGIQCRQIIALTLGRSYRTDVTCNDFASRSSVSKSSIGVSCMAKTLKTLTVIVYTGNVRPGDDRWADWDAKRCQAFPAFEVVPSQLAIADSEAQ